MSRLAALLILAALALVALGAYDIMRGGPDLAAAPPAPPAPATLELSTATTPLGTVVTSGGHILYRFDKDTAKPAKSNCAGQCAATWPPLLATSGTPQLAGVDPALVGIVVRGDGTEQVTIGGWPLYRYSGDKAPGEIRGEGVGGTWHAVGPAGKPAKAGDKAPALAGKPAKAGDKAPAAPSAPAARAPAEAPAPAQEPAPAEPPAPTQEPAPDSGGGY